MSQTITILTGSMRPNSVGDALLPVIKRQLESREDVTVQVADVKELQMPFVDTPHIPMSEEFAPTHQGVKRWREMVEKSDGVILLAPEYNNQPSAVQKNAIDWLYAEWNNKPVAVVSYGWGGGVQAAELLDKLVVKVDAKPVVPQANLFFTKDIALDGEVIDHDNVQSQITSVVDALTIAK